MWKNTQRRLTWRKSVDYPSFAYFHSLTDLSWLAEATNPTTLDAAKPAMSPSCAARETVLLSDMFQSSKDCKKEFPTELVDGVPERS